MRLFLTKSYNLQYNTRNLQVSFVMRAGDKDKHHTITISLGNLNTTGI